MIKLNSLFGNNFVFIVAIQKQTKKINKKKNAKNFCRKYIFDSTTVCKTVNGKSFLN